MEKVAGISKKRDNSVTKRTRKRSYTRKASLSGSFIDMAEARREIVNALNLHRSSSSKPAVPCSSSDNQSCCYDQLTDTMPVPEPTWSTTAPVVLCAPVPVPAVEVVELEWFNNVVSSSSSYSWWLGFLDSLDGKREGAVSGLTGSGDGLRPCLDVEKSGVDVNDQNRFMDEWVVFPTADECGELCD